MGFQFGGAMLIPAILPLLRQYCVWIATTCGRRGSRVCSPPRRVGIDATTHSRQGQPMSTDAIVLLQKGPPRDQEALHRVRTRLRQCGKTKGRLVDKIIELLTVHTYIENEVMYPRVQELLPDLEDDIL